MAALNLARGGAQTRAFAIRKALGASWLYEVRASDPLILAAAVSAVSLLTLATFSLSATRGSQVEPGEILKSD